MLHLDVPPAKIVDTIRDRILLDFMAQHGIVCRKQGEELFLKSEHCSDWYITKKDVYNMKQQIDAASWKRHPNAATSVELFYQSLPEEHKLLYQPQCPKAGTPDHEFFYKGSGSTKDPHALYGDPNHTQAFPNPLEDENAAPMPGPPPSVPVYRDGAEVFQYNFENWTDFKMAFMHKSLLELPWHHMTDLWSWTPRLAQTT